MTHHERQPVEFDNGTMFHFVAGTAGEVLQLALDAAEGRDVRLGGGPSTIRQSLAADLVDVLHLVTVPIVLGAVVSLWDGLAGVQDRFDITSVASSYGRTHHFWNRRSEAA